MEATARQLSLALENPARVSEEEPELLTGSLAIAGRLNVSRNLYRRDRVRVIVTDADGELLATGEATVSRVGFDFHEDKQSGLKWTERAHRVKLD